jgi:hypothetical protein
MPLPTPPHTPRKCHLSASKPAHAHLIRRFAGADFQQQAAEFSRLLYRCVRIHCSLRVSEDDALTIIVSWVASCISDDDPIVTFSSSGTSPTAILSPVLTNIPFTLDPSTSSSFFSLTSEDLTFISGEVGLEDTSDHGWAPDSDF